MFDKEAVLSSIRRFHFRPPASRPCLLLAPEDMAAVRRTAAERADLVDELYARSASHMETPGGEVNALQPYISGDEAVWVAQAYALAGEACRADWVKARLTALLELPTWFSPVHEGACRVCDHVMANLAAQVALAHDLLGDCCTSEETDDVVAGLRRLHFDPFLDATGQEPEWWFRPDMKSNWKIMTCGDSGFAVCSFADRWDRANEALARAARGVIEMLDDVPPEGDWIEGVGYWFGTLWMGLRFARTLRRITGGEVDLFDHPALQVTGDFLALLTTPAGRVYNFNDANAELNPRMVESLAMLAVELRREDWMHVARMRQAASILYLACDDPSLPSTRPTRRVGCFPTSGAVSLRAGWDRQDSFVALKAGPSTAGHSHLDANSFILEARGRALVIEHPYWPQAHFLGFFDTAEGRWNFDGPATVGHSTLLVDGRGQSWGPECTGQVLDARDEGDFLLATGDASHCYPGLLRRFVRTILLIPPDVVIVRDLVACVGRRHVEWLLHHAGTVRSDGAASVIENEQVRLTVVPFLPDRANGWRVSDVVRTSSYEGSDARRQVSRSVAYRSFSPFRAADEFEFLFGLRVGDDDTGGDWQFRRVDDGWTLRPARLKWTVRPDGDGLVVVG